MQDKVNIIMTVKNGEDTVKDTIDSILLQTLQEFKLIIVNDGSTDCTIDIIESVKDNRIQVIKTEGVGRSKALNIALNHCNSNYICNVDVDDPMHPKRLEIQYNYMIKNDFVGVLCTKVQLLIDYEVPKWLNQDCKKSNEVSKNDLMIKNPIAHSSVMFNKNNISNLFYNEDLKCNVDYELWLRLIASGTRIVKLDSELSSKRIHNNQSFENKKRIEYLVTSFHVQRNGIRTLNGNIKYKIIVYIKFIYGLIPQKYRMKINQRKNKKEKVN